jgi:lysophospholipase L1-like esterase
MNNQSYELHNIAELDSASAHPGPLVRRIPKAVAETLENGALVAEDAALSEIRFAVESGRRLSFSVTALNGNDLFVYRGDFLHNHVRLPANGVYRHILDFETDCFAGMRPEAFAGNVFSRHVWRVVFDGPVLFHGLDLMGCTIRPPQADEKPSRRWLAYGSSITQGFTPVTRQQGYVAQVARRLGVDVLNLGLAGACFCEPSFADYLATRNDWDFITCELGVNMRNAFTPEEFERRARFLVTTLTARRPGKPVVLITPFTSNADFMIEPDLPARNTAAFRDSQRRIAGEFAGRDVHLIEGTDLLDSFAGLNCDLVHPSTEGHTVIAGNLATRLRALLPAGWLPSRDAPH